MSWKELQRAKVMERLRAGDLSNQEAANELGICRRQIIRLKKKMQNREIEGLYMATVAGSLDTALGRKKRAQILALYRQ